MMDKTSLRFIYKQYISSVEEKYHVSEEEYKEVCYAFNKRISYLMIHEGAKFKLPERMGKLMVSKNKMKYHSVHFNYQYWKETGKQAFHINDHSDNYYAFARWDKRGTKFKNMIYYGFKFTRTNNRELAKVMKTPNGHQIYEIATRKDAI